MNFKESLLKITNFADISLLDDSIIVEFSDFQEVISTSQLNGGCNSNIKSIFNNSLSQKDLDFLENNDIKEFLFEKSRKLGLNPKNTTVLTTTASMENHCISTKSFKNLEVTTIATAGVRVNASAAGDGASYYEENGKYHFDVGTINLVILINGAMPSQSLVESVLTATEAKTQALRDLRVHSLFSNSYATGTGTDGIVIASNNNANYTFVNAGKHSKLGELISVSVIEAIKQALFKQMYLSVVYQHNMIQRLNRFKLDINEFYKDFSQKEKYEFIEKFIVEAKVDENVAITSTILNIIDEVLDNLILKETGFKLASKILDECCNSEVIKQILSFWIEYYLK